jgi:hypothetical protein
VAVFLVAMNVIALPANAIRIGVPMPFSLRDAAGRLLVPRGSTVESEAQRAQLISRGVFIEEAEAKPFTRALAGKLDGMMRKNALLGQIAKAEADGTMVYTAPDKPADPVAVWSELQFRASVLLREPQKTDFLPRLLRLQNDVLEQVNRDADVALFVLLQATSTEPRWYSATHALLVTVVCELAARHISQWSESLRLPLRCAALTMNIAMTELQDQLSQQEHPVNERQRQQIDSHAQQAVDMLRNAGVKEELWLGAVERHHSTSPGPLSAMPQSVQLARLIQRADIFAARMSPRAKRRVLSATAAAQAAYLDEDKKPDEAGAAVIKATGLYPPGSYVKLANGEVAVVLRRGKRANEPSVASIVGRDGLPLGVPAVRDTRLASFTTTGGLPPHEVKVVLNVERVLKLK